MFSCCVWTQSWGSSFLSPDGVRPRLPQWAAGTDGMVGSGVAAVSAEGGCSATWTLCVCNMWCSNNHESAITMCYVHVNRSTIFWTYANWWISTNFIHRSSFFQDLSSQLGF